jgi:integrase/recombinase XerD
MPIPSMPPSAADVSVYARHSADCRFTSEKNRGKCRCPKWFYFGRTRERRSAMTRSWSDAEDKARRIRDAADPVKRELEELKNKQARQWQGIEDALDLWIADKESNKAAPETLDTFRTLRKQLLDFVRGRAVYLHEVSTSTLTEWKALWPDRRKSSIAKKRRMARAFFNFCVSQGWLEKSPAEGLSKPSGLDSPSTLPFSRAQYAAILDATYIYDQSLRTLNRAEVSDQAVRLRTLIQVMRWSGMAIRDTVTLRRDRLNQDNLLELRRAKSGVPVTVPLPAGVAEDLRNVPKGNAHNPDYFFWSGRSRARAACGVWNRSFNRLWKLVNPPLDLRDRSGNEMRPHPHMFRDTFAVEFLIAGGSMRELATLLGNTVRICEKHYTPFVPELAEALNAKVRDSWAAQGAPIHAKNPTVSISEGRRYRTGT